MDAEDILFILQWNREGKWMFYFFAFVLSETMYLFAPNL